MMSYMQKRIAFHILSVESMFIVKTPNWQQQV